MSAHRGKPGMISCSAVPAMGARACVQKAIQTVLVGVVCVKETYNIQLPRAETSVVGYGIERPGCAALRDQVVSVLLFHRRAVTIASEPCGCC